MSDVISCQLIHKYKAPVKVARKEKRKKIQSTIQKNCIGLMAARNTFSFNFIVLQTRSAYIFFECQYRVFCTKSDCRLIYISLFSIF